MDPSKQVPMIYNVTDCHFLRIVIVIIIIIIIIIICSVTPHIVMKLKIGPKCGSAHIQAVFKF